MRIMVCDDDDASRYFLETLFTGAGHEAIPVHNGLEALEVARVDPPDLIVSDILMPGMDGYRLASEWRGDPALAAIPFVFYSANYTEPDDERFGRHVGADRFLLKPMEPRALLNEVERLLNLSETGELTPNIPDTDESELLREYNARLVNKLERQLLELQDANANLLGTTETLRHTEHALRGVITASPVAIITLDSESRVTLWNPAAETIFGWVASDVMGELCPLLDASTGAGCMDSLLDSSESVAGHESQLVARDGRLVDVSLSAARLGPGPSEGMLALLTDITAQKETQSDLARSVQKLSEMMNGTVAAIAKIVEARDPYTSGHQERVAELAEAIAIEMGFDADTCAGIRMAGMIHDIGKVYVPAEILTKPRRLTDVEFNLVKMHPEVAYDVLSSIDFPWPVATYVIQHHERLDGSGYPHGLTTDEILPGSRILAVADVVEAMSSHRPYKLALGIDVALEEISARAGTAYDADVASACERLFNARGFTLGASLPFG